MELRKKIVEKLKQIKDQGTTVDVISMGLIKNLIVTEDAKVSFEIQPSSSICPLVFSLAHDIKNSLLKLNEIKELNITIIGHQMADDINKYLTE
ncbi:MAG: iron-sulfur cluster assembly protein [Spirochaetota bacterium]|nr:iron-sulfur cluster assembly protein [Spirochaetota bacterium]